MSQLYTHQLQSNLKVSSQPYKQSRVTSTDMRLQQIKKKYDTPSHRQNLSSLGPNERSRDHYDQNKTSNGYTSPYRNILRDSKTSCNVLRREGDLTVSIQVPNFREQNLQKSFYEQLEKGPRLSFDSREKENSSFMQKFTNIKNSMRIQQRPLPKEVSKFREYPSSKIVPRVQHIDEINLKIKQILECLHDDNASKYDQNNSMKSSLLKRSIMSKTGNQLQETKILSRQKFTHERQNYTGKQSIIQLDRYSLSPQAKQSRNTKWRLEDKYNEMKQSSCLLNDSLIKKAEQKEEDSQLEQVQKPKQSRNKRTRSCLGTLKNEDFLLNSGKKLDDQISKINTRIKQFEEEKKKLNIDFKPYHYQMKYNRSASNLVDKKYQRIPNPSMHKSRQSSNAPSFHRLPQKLRTQADQTSSSYILDGRKSLNISLDYNQLKGRNSSCLRMQGNQKLEYKQNAVESQERLPKFKQIEPQIQKFQPNNNDLQKQFKLKTEQGIEERKKKLLQTATVSFSRETKRLISNLFQQVKLDEDLRNAKIWYRDLFDSDKQYNLRSQLESNGLEISQCQFEVTEEEDNPFYSVRESQQSFSCLVERWLKAENYWKLNIAGQFNLREFQAEKFTVQKVDLEKKGFFQIEDLVRFINMETGTFYRNRDLILVFRRMTRSNRLEWWEFVSILDQKH